MKVYINTLSEGQKMKAIYLLSSIGSFYAEPINDGLIGDGLLYNEYMFHFEGNEDRTVVILKDSKERVKDALTGWLQNYPNPEFVTNNRDNLNVLSDLGGLNIDDYHTTVVGIDDKDLPLIEKTETLKKVYDAKG